MNYSNEVPECRLLAGDILTNMSVFEKWASCLCQSHMTYCTCVVDAEAYSFILFFVGVRITFFEVTRRCFVFGFWGVLFLEKSFTHKRKRLVQMRC